MYKNRGKGFTLIELLVVVAIIGILASVILVSLGSARAKARDAKRISDIKQLQTALELYNSSYGRYPIHDEIYPSDPGAGQKYSVPAGFTCPTTAGYHCMFPEFIPAPPTDPSTGAAYFYAGLQIKTQGTTAGLSCLTYHLGGNMEQVNSDSPIMKSAPHAAPNTGGGNATSLSCSGGTDFDASAKQSFCFGGVISSLDANTYYCYDATP
ncbi:MAG: prepilin-type N-terminal cleavage/methylation domain-containing protein [Candidatus Vogelbacteria bacterium]|nr:prepilin-type N-terminal cleavage/methylation domain-containing protein [Candidatus Vogelbacteria bacterium]